MIICQENRPLDKLPIITVDVWKCKEADFYTGMGLNPQIGEMSFTITATGNIIKSVVKGFLIGYAIPGNFFSGIVPGLVDYSTTLDPGDYWVRTTSIEVYDPYDEVYKKLTTYEVYYKHPSYDTYTEEPVIIQTELSLSYTPTS